MPKMPTQKMLRGMNLTFRDPESLTVPVTDPLPLIHNFQEGMRENFVKKNKNKTKKQKDRKSVIILPFSFDQVSIRSLRTDWG